MVMKGTNEKFRKIIKKFGIAGLVFFFLKGMAWLLFGGALTRFIMELVDKA